MAAAVTRNRIKPVMIRAVRLASFFMAPPSQSAEPAVPALVGVDDGGISFRGKVRPGDLGEDQLRIGALEEQVVAQAHLPAGAHDEVGIRLTGGEQVLGNGILADRLRGQTTGGGIGGDGADSADDFIPTAVIEGDIADDAGIGAGAIHALCMAADPERGSGRAPP